VSGSCFVSWLMLLPLFRLADAMSMLERCRCVLVSVLELELELVLVAAAATADAAAVCATADAAAVCGWPFAIPVWLPRGCCPSVVAVAAAASRAPSPPVLLTPTLLSPPVAAGSGSGSGAAALPPPPPSTRKEAVGAWEGGLASAASTVSPRSDGANSVSPQYCRLSLSLHAGEQDQRSVSGAASPSPFPLPLSVTQLVAFLSLTSPGRSRARWPLNSLPLLRCALNANPRPGRALVPVVPFPRFST
jgi:hypothetical protein